jgi:hypothetical protein
MYISGNVINMRFYSTTFLITYYLPRLISDLDFFSSPSFLSFSLFGFPSSSPSSPVSKKWVKMCETWLFKLKAHHPSPLMNIWITNPLDRQLSRHFMFFCMDSDKSTMFARKTWDKVQRCLHGEGWWLLLLMNFWIFYFYHEGFTGKNKQTWCTLF